MSFKCKSDRIGHMQDWKKELRKILKRLKKSGKVEDLGDKDYRQETK